MTRYRSITTSVLAAWLVIAAPGATSAKYEIKLLGKPSVSVATLRGRPVVLAFFSPTCKSCKDFAKRLEAVYERRPSQDVAIFGIVLTEDIAVARAFQRELRLQYPIASDWKEGTCAFIDCSGRFVTPVLVLVERDGEIGEQYHGECPVTTDVAELEHAIQTVSAKGPE